MNRMTHLGLVCVAAFLLTLTSHAQDGDAPFECDNNYGDCGTPEVSGGGGGGGGGSVLINNTDLGDTYQRGDDFDDDGIEDNSDNCPRVRATNMTAMATKWATCATTAVQRDADQFNLDNDAKGDVCDDDIDNDEVLNDLDNCKEIRNPMDGESQPDLDGDGIGDACDDDIDNDGKMNLDDPCPFNANVENPNDEERALCFPDMDGDGFSEVDPVNKDNCAPSLILTRKIPMETALVTSATPTSTTMACSITSTTARKWQMPQPRARACKQTSTVMAWVTHVTTNSAMPSSATSRIASIRKQLSLCTHRAWQQILAQAFHYDSSQIERISRSGTAGPSSLPRMAQMQRSQRRKAPSSKAHHSNTSTWPTARPLFLTFRANMSSEST